MISFWLVTTELAFKLEQIKRKGKKKKKKRKTDKISSFITTSKNHLKEAAFFVSLVKLIYEQKIKKFCGKYITSLKINVIFLSPSKNAVWVDKNHSCYFLIPFSNLYKYILAPNCTCHFANTYTIILLKRNHIIVDCIDPNPKRISDCVSKYSQIVMCFKQNLNIDFKDFMNVTENQVLTKIRWNISWFYHHFFQKPCKASSWFI